MIYHSTKSDLQFMKEFKRKVLRLFDIENEIKKDFKPSVYVMGKDYFDAVLRQATTKTEEGINLREYLSTNIHRAIQIAYKNNVSIDISSLPAPAIGGAVIPVNMFSAIINDLSHAGIDRNWIVDKINETIGNAERKLKKEFCNLINPLFWIYQGIILILRIPFHLISATGFNIQKIEDHLFAKLFKVIELIVIIYLLIKIGFDKSELKEIITKILN